MQHRPRRPRSRPVRLQSARRLTHAERPKWRPASAELQQILAPVHNKTWLAGRPENN